MKRYLFISNSTKPTKEQYESRELIKVGNIRKPCIDVANEMHFEVWVGVNRKSPEELRMDADYPIHLYDSHTYRSLFALKDNIIAYKNASNILKQGDFFAIHCNTPIGGIIGRICGKKYGVKKVIYTAHGFHFYKGAPLLNRTVFKWAEMIMAHWTDAIITMNSEDFEAAKKFRLRNNGKVYYVPGVGVDTEMYKNIEVDRASLRREFGIKEDDTVCISMGDLVPRKNYAVAIDAISKCRNKSIHYLLAGVGPELENLKRLAEEKGVLERIHFIGFRSDIKELLQISDMFLFTTLQEGLPRSMMEAMASGLPCVVSKIRGNVDLINDGEGGYLVSPKDTETFARRLDELSQNKELRERMSKKNLERIKDFDVKSVKKKISEIYEEVLN